MILATTATNGVPEACLEQHYPGTTNYNTAAMSDTDGDGMAAWEEYRAGMDPTNRMSVFVMTSYPPTVSGEFTLEWPSTSNRIYTIYKSTNLTTGWASFGTPIVSNYPSSGSGTTTFVDTNAFGRRAFYYIKVEGPDLGRE